MNMSAPDLLFGEKILVSDSALFSIVELFRWSVSPFICVGYICTLRFITYRFPRQLFLLAPSDTLCFCVAMTFMSLDVSYLWLFITHFIPLWPKLMSDMTSIIFFY